MFVGKSRQRGRETFAHYRKSRFAFVRGMSARHRVGTPRSESMNAIRMHSYGGPEVLQYEDAPCPRVKNGEVLVRVHAAGVNPLDWKVRAGS